MNRQPHLIEFRQIRTLAEEGIKGGIHEDNTRIGIQANGSRWLIKINTSEESDELVSYLLAQKFFEGVVPETHLIELEGKPASAQRMVSGKSAHELEAEGTLYEITRQSNVMRDLANMIVMDYLIGNPDRHGYNWFIMNNDRLAAIDNGFAADDLDMPITAALRPAYKCLLVDDCARTPTLIALMRGIVGRLDGREAEAESIVLENSIARTHLFIGRWQVRINSLKLKLDQWTRELEVHCHETRD